MEPLDLAALKAKLIHFWEESPISWAAQGLAMVAFLVALVVAVVLLVFVGPESAAWPGGIAAAAYLLGKMHGKNS